MVFGSRVKVWWTCNKNSGCTAARSFDSVPVPLGLCMPGAPRGHPGGTQGTMGGTADWYGPDTRYLKTGILDGPALVIDFFCLGGLCHFVSKTAVVTLRTQGIAWHQQFFLHGVGLWFPEVTGEENRITGNRVNSRLGISIMLIGM